MDTPTTTPATTTGQTQPTTAKSSILGDLLKTLGVGQQHVDVIHDQTHAGDVNKQLDQAHSYVTEAIAHAREYGQKNPGAVLGGLSALVIAAGMLRNNIKR